MRLKKSSIVSREKYPEKVRNRFAELRAELPYHITIRAIKNAYYVVKQEYSPLDEHGKRKMSAEYLGKITEDGEFRPRKAASQTAFEVAKAIILAKGGKVVMPKENEGAVYEVSNVQLSKKEENILMNLTMNARMPYDMLAKNTEQSTDRLPNIIGRLERTLKISYVPDIRLTKLGFIEFFIFVKFAEGRPDPSMIRTDLENVGNVQFAANLTGQYDMMLFVLAESNENLAELVKTIKKLPSLSNLSSDWIVSYFYRTKSFMPLRNAFFDILEEKVWHRNKENPRPSPVQLLKSEFSVLKGLGENGSATFAEIERKYDLARGSARHIYDRLIKKEILPRVTVSLDGIRAKYNAIIIMRIKNETLFQESRKTLLEFIMEEEEGYLINRFSLVGDISNPEGVMFFIPVIKGDELEKTVSELQTRVKGISIDTLVIDNIILGKILYRRQDPLTTNQYIALASDYKVKFPDVNVYDEETFYRIEKISNRYKKN